MLLYLHIPYCDSKCHYCAFNSYVDKFDTRQKYMEALKEQLIFELQRFSATEKSIETLFIGGGTPSTVPAELYAPIFKILTPYLAKNAEITSEANPNSASEKWLKGMKKLGLNRISFGVQSFNEKKLKDLNRAHTPEQAKKAILRAANLGFEHISLDLIYNYDGDTKDLLQNDIEEAFKLPIDHISAYELTIEENTKFASTPELRQDDEKLAFFVADEIKKRGFKQYEISNYGSYESSHNKGYWELKDYIGAGAGAVGFLENRRFYPQTDIDQYIAEPLNVEVERLSQNDILTEKVFLGLRSKIGVDKSILTEHVKKCKLLTKREKINRIKNTFL